MCALYVLIGASVALLIGYAMGLRVRSRHAQPAVDDDDVDRDGLRMIAGRPHYWCSGCNAWRAMGERHACER